jgi:hypothetical protein
MTDALWTWDAQEHPGVAGVLAVPPTTLGWCNRLETAPRDAIVGKVLCACAALAIAQKVLTTLDRDDPQAAAAMELLNRWIDDPTDERFDRICSLIFDEGSPEFDPYGIVWWALRAATSSVGNFEACWALEAVCDAALKAGLTPEHLQPVVEQELSSRLRPASRAF